MGDLAIGAIHAVRIEGHGPECGGECGDAAWGGGRGRRLFSRTAGSAGGSDDGAAGGMRDDQSPLPDYSERRAVKGSTRAARRAGARQAVRATAAKRTATMV